MKQYNDYKTMKRVLIFTIVLITGFTFAQADDLTFTASVPEAVVSGQKFRLSYRVNTQKVKNFRATDFSDFDVLSGPNSSSETSMQIVNGKVTNNSSITYSYMLVGNKEGTFTIPAASITADGETLTSNAVTIKVLPPDKASSGSGTGGSGATANPSQNSGTTQISNSDLFIRTIVNKKTVYEQEAVLLTYKIYSLVNLTELQGKMPDLKGFHTQEIELSRNKTWSLEHYNGRNYRTITWSQYVLFPQQTGDIEIPSIRFDGVVVQQVRRQYVDPFDAFFNGASNHVEVKKELFTPQETIHVNPLPDGKPESYAGGVGNFTLSSSISTQELKANEAVTLQVVVSGNGNMKLLKTPEVQFPKDFEVYDPKIENKFSLKSDGQSGSKVYEYLAIPRFPGKYTIPSVKFSYFDVKTKSYKTLETQEYTLNVEKGSETSGSVSADYVSKEDLRLLGQDIRFLKLNSDATLHTKGDFFFGTLYYYLCYIIPALLFVILVSVYRQKAVESANIVKVRIKKANKVATRRMKTAKKLLSSNKKNEFYDEVLKALWGYTGDKLDIPVSRLSKDNITQVLTEKGVDGTLIKEFEKVLNDCEFARYAPATGKDAVAMENTYSSAVQVISNMDNQIKK